MTTAHPIMGPWVRDGLRRSGITPASLLHEALDAIIVQLAGVPYEDLTKLRDQIEIAKLAAGIRDTWGSLPHQQQEMAVAMGLQT